MPFDLSQLKDGEEVSPSFLSSDSSPDLSKTPDGAEVPLPASQLRQLIAGNPYFPVTREIAKTIYEDDKQKGLGQRVGEAVGAIPEGLSQLGSQVAAAHNEMKDEPMTWPNFQRTANTITEAGAEGALNTIGMGRRIGRNLWDWLKEKVTGASDDEKIDNYLKELQLRQKVERTARGLPEVRPENFNPEEPSFVLKGYGDTPPYPHAAQVLSLPLDPAFMAGAGAVGAAGKLAGTALRSIPAGAKAMEILDAAKALPGKAVSAGLKGVEKVGQVVSDAAKYPVEAATEKLSGVLPEGTAEKLGHLAGPGSIAAAVSGHGGPVTAVVALLKSTEWGAKLASDTAGFFRRLAETNGESAVPRLVQLAANPETPQWIQVAAGKLDSLGIGKATHFATDLGESGVHGALTGAGLSAAAGDSPKEVGQAAGAGLGLGVAGRGFRKFAGADAMARRVAATIGARQRFYEFLRSDLKMPEEKIAQVDDFTAATLGHARDIFGGDKLKLQFLDPADAAAAAQAQGGAGGAAWFDPKTGTINLRLGDKSFRESHELGHAILQAVGADGEARLTIDGLFTPEQLQAHGREYAAKLVKSNDPAVVQQTVNDLNQAWGGDKWIYDELYAEAGYGGFMAKTQRSGPHFMQDIVGANKSLWSRLGDRARATFLNTTGDFFDPETGKPAVPKGAIFSDPEIYNNGPLRRLVFEHLRRVMRQGAEIRQGKDETAPASIPANLIGKHPAAPKEMLKENGMFFENAKGELQPAPRLAAKLDREKSKQVQQNILNQPVKPKGDTSPEVAPRITSTGETEVTGSKIAGQLKKLPAYGEWARKIAAMAEGLMGTGKVFNAWYFPVGEGFPWRRSVARNAGDLPAKQIDLAPFEFRVDKKGHVLITGLSVTASDRKIMRWKQEGKLDVLWGGDAGKFREDLTTYLRNHAEGKPGAETIGDNKRNALNTFLIGKQARLADLNPLRAGLMGEDRQGIIRSLRLDRISSTEQSQHEGWQAEYPKKKINASPGVQFSPQIPRLPEKMFRDTEQREWYGNAKWKQFGRDAQRPTPEAVEGMRKDWEDYLFGLHQNFGEDAALWPANFAEREKVLRETYENARILVDGAGEQSKLKLNDEAAAKPAEGLRPVQPHNVPDGATGLPSFYGDSDTVSYDTARGNAKWKAAATSAREVILSMVEASEKEAGREFSEEDRQRWFRALGRSTSTDIPSEGFRRDAARLIFSDPAEFEQEKAEQNYPPSVIAAAEAARERLPVASQNSPLYRFFLSNGGEEESRFKLLARASEGPVILDKDSGFVYKITHPTFYQSDINEGEQGRELTTRRAAGLFDILNRYDRQNALRGTLPIEPLGLFMWGDEPLLVLKMPRMEREATRAEALKWINENGVGKQKTQLDPKGLIRYDAVGRNQPVSRDFWDNYYQLLDFRESEEGNFLGRRQKTGNYPNLMVDKGGKVLLTDTAPFPIDEQIAAKVPALKEFTPPNEEAAKNVAYSPGVEPQLVPPGESEAGESLEEKRRLTRREVLQLGQRFPESVPVKVDAKGTAKKVDYGLVDSPMVQRHGEEKAALFLGTRVAREIKKNLSNPEVADAVGWYRTFRGSLQRVYGMSQLLAATSARTGVRDNFRIAEEAVRRYSKGEYDELLSRYAKFLEAGGKEKDWQEMPLKSNGAKFNANSRQVLRVLAGDWAEKAGQKTSAFAENLSAEDAPATIDVWASRTLRRLLYAGETDRWRILPASEKSVSKDDFQFAQQAMAEAGKRLNLPPEDVQSVLWFAEKDLWEKNGWTRGTGAEKSSFQREFSKQLGQEQPGDLAGVATPQEPIRMQAGVTDFTTPEKFSGAAHTKEGAQIRSFIGKLPGLMASRVKDTLGLYGTPEPSWDIEFTVKEPRSANQAEKFFYEKGKQHGQTDTMAVRIVDEQHPNARPGVEVLFKRPMTLEEVQSSIVPLLNQLGIDGMTPAMDQRGRVIGFRTQFVPEISARWADPETRAKLLDPAQCRAMGEEWMNMKGQRLIDMLDPKLLRYALPHSYDTRVFGKEEVEYPERPEKTSYETEFARRSAALDQPSQ